MPRRTFLNNTAGCLIILCALLMPAAMSCRHGAKGQPVPVKPAIHGLWEGAYITNQVDHAPTYCSFVVFPDGSFIKKSQVTTHTDEFQLTKGSWRLNGDQFEYRDTVLLYSGGIVIDEGRLTFHENGTMDHGTWKDVSGQSYTGKFLQMRKVY